MSQHVTFLFGQNSDVSKKTHNLKSNNIIILSLMSRTIERTPFMWEKVEEISVVLDPRAACRA